MDSGSLRATVYPMSTSNNDDSVVVNIPTATPVDNAAKFRRAESLTNVQCPPENFVTGRTHPAFKQLLESPPPSSTFEPFYFIHAADPQYGMIAAYVRRSPEAAWGEERCLVQAAVKQINTMSPKPVFVAVTGDLVHAMPGLPQKAAQEVDLLEDFGRLDSSIPVIYLPGNHDVGDIVTPDAVKSYTRRFGDDYYAFTYKRVRFLVLNSQFFKPLCGELIQPDGTTTVVPKPAAGVEQLQRDFIQWLDDELENSRRGIEAGSFNYTIIFQHIPWFLVDADEPDQYFNIEKMLRLNYMRKFELAGVKAVLCGHLHENSEGTYNGKVGMITRTAVCVPLDDKPAGMGTVICYSDRIVCQYYPTAKVPGEVQLSVE